MLVFSDFFVFGQSLCRLEYFYHFNTSCESISTFLKFPLTAKHSMKDVVFRRMNIRNLTCILENGQSLFFATSKKLAYSYGNISLLCAIYIYTHYMLYTLFTIYTVLYAIYKHTSMCYTYTLLYALALCLDLSHCPRNIRS